MGVNFEIRFLHGESFIVIFYDSRVGKFPRLSSSRVVTLLGQAGQAGELRTYAELKKCNNGFVNKAETDVSYSCWRQSENY